MILKINDGNGRRSTYLNEQKPPRSRLPTEISTEQEQKITISKIYPTGANSRKTNRKCMCTTKLKSRGAALLVKRRTNYHQTLTPAHPIETEAKELRITK